jgi:non-homologous end joining protein Ku
MAARATWKGFLNISLVNIPIKVFPATESNGTISLYFRLVTRSTVPSARCAESFRM